MASSELPELQGFLRLENPEIADAPKLEGDYSLWDVARFHLKTIQTLGINRDTPFTIMGMSMGGMIASVLASELRAELPVRTQFRFLVTSGNLPELPAVPPALLKTWFEVKPGSVEGFTRIMAPFFSKGYRERNAQEAAAYYEYRAMGKNRQSPKAFVRQLNAVLAFDGRKTFAEVNPKECRFVGGAEDYIFGPEHDAALRGLCPDASHATLAGLGHMIQLEQPALFAKEAAYGTV